MGGVSKRQQVTGLFELQSGEMPVIVQYQNGKVLHEIPEPGIKSVLFMPDGQTLVTVSDDQIKFWNVEDFSQIKSVAVYNTKSISSSPDGRIMAVSPENDNRFNRTEVGALLGALSSGSYLFLPKSEGLILDPGNGQVQHFVRSCPSLQPARTKRHQ